MPGARVDFTAIAANRPKFSSIDCIFRTFGAVSAAFSLAVIPIIAVSRAGSILRAMATPPLPIATRPVRPAPFRTATTAGETGRVIVSGETAGQLEITPEYSPEQSTLGQGGCAELAKEKSVKQPIELARMVRDLLATGRVTIVPAFLSLFVSLPVLVIVVCGWVLPRSAMAASLWTETWITRMAAFAVACLTASVWGGSCDMRAPARCGALTCPRRRPDRTSLVSTLMSTLAGGAARVASVPVPLTTLT